MLHLIPAPLHRMLYRIADWVRKRWWLIYRPRRSSVNVVAFDPRGRVLLVRHSYGRPVWTVPGGGSGRSEDPQVAARREFREELGCELSGLTLLEAREWVISGSRDTVSVYAARLEGEPRPDMREIVEVGFFDPDSLPPNCSAVARRWTAKGVEAANTGAFTYSSES